MKSRLDCYPCFVRIALQASRLAGIDESKEQKIMFDCLELLQENIVGKSPLLTVHRIQNIVRKHTGCEDPYSKVKWECNQEAEHWLPHLREQVEEAEDSLYTALKIAAIGNIMDYGAFANFDLTALVQKLDRENFAIDQSSKFLKRLSHAKTITYFCDNAGEIYFDTVLIEQFCKIDQLEKINVVIRKSPFLNDVDSLNFVPTDLDDQPKVEIHQLSVVREEHDPNEWNELTSADLIISKGMANFENYSDEADFFFLLISKCDLVSRLISERTNTQVKTGDWILMG